MLYSKTLKMEALNLKQTIQPSFKLLKLTFGIVPIVAGLDKFTNLRLGKIISIRVSHQSLLLTDILL